MKKLVTVLVVAAAAGVVAFLAWCPLRSTSACPFC